MRTFLHFITFKEMYCNFFYEVKMKKILYTMALLLCVSNAHAETILVIDDNGYVTQKMSTNTSQVIVQPASTTVVQQQPAVTVVRETPQVSNSYYYDSYSTGSLLAAGLTTAVVGALLFDGFHVKHHHSPAPKVIHGPSPKHHHH